MRNFAIKLVNFLWVISLVAVGFSAWNIIRPVEPVTASGAFSVDGVYSSDDYISPDTDKGGFQCFNYCIYGFEPEYNTENGKFTDDYIQKLTDKETTATITADLKIDLDKCKKSGFFTDYNSLLVYLELGYSAPNKPNNAKDIIDLITGVAVNTTAEYSSLMSFKSDNNYATNVTFQNALNKTDTLNFTVTWTLTHTGAYSAFKDDYADLLSSDDFCFTLNAKISGTSV